VTFSLIRGDATSIPLADDSVDCRRSRQPPYFALRSYTDGGEHYDGQIGSEATPQAFLDALWAVTAECRRVLKPSGSMFVNLGDKYSGSGSKRRTVKAERDGTHARQRFRGDFGGVPAKSLMGLPWRYAIGCIDPEYR
jgi:DNA modification methylase